MNVSYYRQILNQDSKTDPFILITTLACCCLSGAFSVTGNGMVLFLICRSRSFRNNATFIFIANICVSDIMISTLVVPFQFQIHLLKRWVMPAFLCYACLTVQTLMVSNSVFTLTAIALERYRAILNPLKTRLSKGQVKIEIAIIWLLSFLTCIPTFFSYNVQMEMDPFTRRRTLAQCVIKDDLYRYYYRLLILIHYFIPLCIISYCYVRMAIELNGDMPEIAFVSNINYTKLIRGNRRKVNEYE